MGMVSRRTVNMVSKALMTPVKPLQVFMDAPSPTHGYCLQHAYDILCQDGKDDVAAYFRPFDRWLRKGSFWADQGWRNVCHYFFASSKFRPGAETECQYYFDKAVTTCQQDITKGMFYLGAAVHLVQDMCVPHHAAGAVFDGHKEFETWAGENLQHFSAAESGIYMPFTGPSEWIRYNAARALTYYPLVSKGKGCDEGNYFEAARELLPLTIYTTAGFLDFAKPVLQQACVTIPQTSWLNVAGEKMSDYAPVSFNHGSRGA
ncbi:phospholipase C [Acididesulfobacillus acetoxydans]|uniref:Phospholipase C n=2 Tax=Acididesulfobacillus acetoxydans TaxID=1561005 RepID=A0A8S0VYU5_9FIRM|nr:phospholipase C [Acididesulfobacillus acetoxydans]CEJ09298.1 Transcriptional antiterminator [Acididesulfobacillus acetoxydans]